MIPLFHLHRFHMNFFVKALESGQVPEEPYACQYDDTAFENSHHFASDNVETGDAVDEGSRSKYLEDDYAWRPILRLGWGDDNETYEVLLYIEVIYLVFTLCLTLFFRARIALEKHWARTDVTMKIAF